MRGNYLTTPTMENDSFDHKSSETKLCSHCQKQIPKKATRCPYCQTDLHPWYNKYPILTVVIFIIIICIVCSAINSANQSPISQSTGTASGTNQPASAGSASPSTVPSQTAVIPTAVWHVEYTYSNNTTIQTPPFSMHGGEWKVTYTCDSTPGYFGGNIDSTSDGIEAAEIANDPSCPTTQTSYAYGQSAGQYYLDMTSDGNSYSVTVSDYY